MSVQIVRHKFTVDDYHRMAKAGILSEDDRVELIEGEIVAMAPIGDRHAGTVDFLAESFFRYLGDQVQVRVQSPIRLGEHSELQPDLALLKRRPDFYRDRHPSPQEVLLSVEVAETSPEYDREVKIPLYARFGVSEVWLVDLEAGAVEVYRGPSGEGYQQQEVLRRGEVISPKAFPEIELPVGEILGKAR
ncbi:TPA: Uma2 family endonuclease [Candidatus Bipolaricaulota bacterium]|nr:Uma2 family endonuclease [Candidatus Bipolaricaulota bacterium]